jgi:hypothetical protein
VKTLIVCATAAEAKLLERTFFPFGEGVHQETLCIGAGAAIAGYGFYRVIYMPGWNREHQQWREWQRLVVQPRRLDVNFHMELYL